MIIRDGTASKLKIESYYDKTQVSFRDRWGTWHNLKVTELWTKNQGGVDAGTSALLGRVSDVRFGKVILRLGLARAWAGTDGAYEPKRCYLQLNGIILPN